MRIHIINVSVNVSKKIANTIREMIATIDETNIGQRMATSKIIEKIITKSNATKSPRVIKNPPFMLYRMKGRKISLLNRSYCVSVCVDFAR